MNCQSIKNKKADIHTVIESAKPDIIYIFPESFDAIRKDRASDAHSGVFIAFNRDLCTEAPELDTKCEKI